MLITKISIFYMMIHVKLLIEEKNKINFFNKIKICRRWLNKYKKMKKVKKLQKNNLETKVVINKIKQK